MNNPKLRFRDDSGSRFVDWQKVSFGKTFSFLKSSAFSRAQLNYRGGQIKNVHYGDILVKFPTILNSCCNDVPYVNPAEKTEKYDLLQVGDIVIADTAEDLTVGKAIEISDVSNNIIAGLHTIACRPQRKFANRFLGYYLNSKAFHNQLVPLATGIKVYSIIKSEIVKTRINVPCLEEQQKIASFFSTLDEKIELSKHKLKALEQLKKGLMQKIFSQEVRFKDSKGNDYCTWKNCSLSDISEPLSYGLNAAASEFDGLHKYLRITDIDERTYQYLSSDPVSPSVFPEEKYRLKEGDIVFARTGNSVGKTYLYDKNDGDLYYAGFLIKAHIRAGICPYFVFLQTQTPKYKNWVRIMSQRSGQPGINAEEYGKYQFLLPCLEEQEKNNLIV